MPSELPLDPAVPSPDTDPERLRRLLAARARHWRSTRRLTFTLLALWLATGFCTVFFARELSRVTLFGWPLSFYMAAQGAALVCLAIIGGYAWQMRRLDRAHARALEGGA
jgi:putative solute:sodium symporter small subunit